MGEEAKLVPDNARCLDEGAERVHPCVESRDAIAHRQNDFADRLAANTPRADVKVRCTDDEFERVDETFARSGEEFARVGERFAWLGEEFGGVGEEFEPSGEELQALRAWFSSRTLATTPSTKTTRHNDKGQRRSHLRWMHAALGRALSTQ